ncbi:hypothetical protein WKW50_05255 [Ochrobactrum sp. GPK 3]
MVRAILREIKKPGTGKTQTRRVLKSPFLKLEDGVHPGLIVGKEYFSCCSGGDQWATPSGAIKYRPGDRLYVREAWRVSRIHDQTAPRDLKPRTMTVFFEAGGSIANQNAPGDWMPDSWPEDGERPYWAGKFRQAMHIPRWASRITLGVTGVKVERLQDCSEADAIAEGIAKFGRFYGVPEADWDSASTRSAVDAYANLWDEINGSGAWDKNPWVAAYTFRPILGNIDQIARAA